MGHCSGMKTSFGSATTELEMIIEYADGCLPDETESRLVGGRGTLPDFQTRNCRKCALAIGRQPRSRETCPFTQSQQLLTPTGLLMEVDSDH